MNREMKVTQRDQTEEERRATLEDGLIAVVNGDDPEGQLPPGSLRIFRDRAEFEIEGVPAISLTMPQLNMLHGLLEAMEQTFQKMIGDTELPDDGIPDLQEVAAGND